MSATSVVATFSPFHLGEKEGLAEATLAVWSVFLLDHGEAAFSYWSPKAPSSLVAFRFKQKGIDLANRMWNFNLVTQNVIDIIEFECEIQMWLRKLLDARNRLNFC